MQNMRFSGHETFICKQLWPKKGYDFLLDGNKFSEADAVVKLGVGKNMVLSIKFWMNSLGLIDHQGNSTELSREVLSNQGHDPFIEDIGTIWLLHYKLVSLGYASLYNIVFNEYAKIKTEFTKTGLQNFIKRLATNSNGNSFNEKTVSNDVDVFLKNYLHPHSDSKVSSIEDEFAGLFQDLDLIKHFKKNDQTGKQNDYYFLERKERASLPKEIFLYTILINERLGDNISFNELVSGINSVGNVFLLNRDGIYKKIEELIDEYEYISFSQTAGVPLIQFDKKPDPDEILAAYYAN